MSAAVSLNTSEEDMGGFYALILMSVFPLSYLLVRSKGERHSLLSLQPSVTPFLKKDDIPVDADHMATIIRFPVTYVSLPSVVSCRCCIDCLDIDQLTFG